MSKFFTDHVLCIATGPSSCKLVLTMNVKPRSSKLSLFSNPERQQKFADNFAYSIGFLSESFKQKGLSLSGIDFVFPAFAQYLQLEEILRKTLKTKFEVKVLCGTTILIPDREINQNMAFFNQQIADFSASQINNN